MSPRATRKASRLRSGDSVLSRYQLLVAWTRLVPSESETQTAQVVRTVVRRAAGICTKSILNQALRPRQRSG